MDAIKKINAKIAVAQSVRLMGGIASVVLGMILFGRFMYQMGITDEQKFLSKAYPDEYAAITEKVIKKFEKH